MSDLTELLAQHRAIAEKAGGGRHPKRSWQQSHNEVRSKPSVSPMVTAEAPHIASHIALNDPDVALALNAVAEAASAVHWSAAQRPGTSITPNHYSVSGRAMNEMGAALAHLHEVLQAKMGEQG